MKIETQIPEPTITLVTPSDMSFYTFTDNDGKEWNYDYEYLKEVMDYVTADETCTKYFWNMHADICCEHFNGKDWTWREVLEYWDVEDVEEAIEIYENKDVDVDDEEQE